MRLSPGRRNFSNMKIIFDSYSPGESIPVQQFIKNKKLAKYFNRETAAAIVSCGKLLRGAEFDPDLPFYYETGVMEFEDLGLDAIAAGSLDEQGNFSQHLFVEKGAKAVHPLTQFKALYNMPLSFVSIEHGLTGDNAVIYASARGLLMQALHAPGEKDILLGSGKLYSDGRLHSSFALIGRDEIEGMSFPESGCEAIDLFRNWAAGDRP